MRSVIKKSTLFLGSLIITFAGLFALLPFSTSATVIPTPATATLYGDSIMFESTNQIASQFATKAGWTFKNTSYPGSAPCDWFAQLQSDLATLHPKIVVLETQGNSLTPCMRDANGNQIVFGSQAWLNKYRTDLDFYFSTATAAGAKVLFVYPLPESSSSATKSLVSLKNMALAEAGKYHGVSVSGAPRNAVTSSGTFVWRKTCLSTETASMGCGAEVAGKIRVRSPDGVHLCPINPNWSVIPSCSVYSSGEFRWSKSLVSTTINPPAPILP